MTTYHYADSNRDPGFARLSHYIVSEDKGRIPLHTPSLLEELGRQVVAMNRGQTEDVGPTSAEANYSNYDGDYNYIYDDDYYLYQESRDLSNGVFTYLGVLFLVVGTMGNITALLVAQMRPFCVTSCGFLFSALALVDTGVLYTGLLRHTVLGMTADQLDVRSLSSAGCKCHTFLTYMMLQLSAWTQVLLTFHSLVTVVWPLKVRAVCSLSRMIMAWVVITVALVGINSHSFVTVALQDMLMGTKVVHRCFPHDMYADFWKNMWSYIDAAIFFVIPVVIFILGVIVIGHALCCQGDRTLWREGDGSAAGVAKIVVCIAVLFLVAGLPSSIYYIGTWPSETAREEYNRTMAHTGVTVLLNCICALKFFVYCVASAGFRKSLVALFTCRK